MKHVAVIALLVVTALLLLGMQDAGSPALPPEHPPVVPQGHPPIPQDAEAPPNGAPTEAVPADVESIEAIVAAYYGIISGKKGEPRDWDRFRTLFAPNARFITMRAAGGAAAPIMLTPEQLIATNKRYFERGGYFEREVASETETYGRVAHVFSTYETRRRLADKEPYSRGINSIQLISDEQRWWIVTIMWDFERAGNPIPAEYLQDDDGAAAAADP